MDMAGALNLIPAEAEPIVLELLGRINRLRSLKDDESRLTEGLVKREKRRQPSRTHVWTREDDRTLRRVQHRPRGVAEFAEKIGVSESAAWSRVQVLRHPHKRRAKTPKVEG